MQATSTVGALAAQAAQAAQAAKAEALNLQPETETQTATETETETETEIATETETETESRSDERFDARIAVRFVDSGPLGISWGQDRSSSAVRVKKVQGGSQAAAQHGLQLGSILVKINGEDVSGQSFKDTVDKIRSAGRPLELELEQVSASLPLPLFCAVSLLASLPLSVSLTMFVCVAEARFEVGQVAAVGRDSGHSDILDPRGAPSWLRPRTGRHRIHTCNS